MFLKAGESEATEGRGGSVAERWSTQHKTEVVLRLLRGEDLGEMSREIRVSPWSWRSGGGCSWRVVSTA